MRIYFTSYGGYTLDGSSKYYVRLLLAPTGGRGWGRLVTYIQLSFLRLTKHVYSYSSLSTGKSTQNHVIALHIEIPMSQVVDAVSPLTLSRFLRVGPD